ncbi:MAG: hypothetical protein COB65_08945 [Thalassobium sp.]|nr:MAG: hypothetical protein COB65_08945 [Thalassobium sp.]
MVLYGDRIHLPSRYRVRLAKSPIRGAGRRSDRRLRLDSGQVDFCIKVSFATHCESNARSQSPRGVKAAGRRATTGRTLKTQKGAPSGTPL